MRIDISKYGWAFSLRGLRSHYQLVWLSADVGGFAAVHLRSGGVAASVAVDARIPARRRPYLYGGRAAYSYAQQAEPAAGTATAWPPFGRNGYARPTRPLSRSGAVDSFIVHTLYFGAGASLFLFLQNGQKWCIVCFAGTFPPLF